MPQKLLQLPLILQHQQLQLLLNQNLLYIQLQLINRLHLHRLMAHYFHQKNHHHRLQQDIEPIRLKATILALCNKPVAQASKYLPLPMMSEQLGIWL
jgi:hypothetical protein